MALEVQASSVVEFNKIKMWKQIALLAIVASVRCTPVQENGVAESLVGAVTECIETDTSLCLKVNIVDTQVLWSVSEQNPKWVSSYKDHWIFSKNN